MRNNENSIEEEPCRCVEGFQCYPINCEYCEKIPTCRPGQGLETKHGEKVHNTEHPPFITSPYKRVVNPRLRFVLLIIDQRKVCEPCPKGFFSDKDDDEPCKPWTK